MRQPGFNYNPLIPHRVLPSKTPRLSLCVKSAALYGKNARNLGIPRPGIVPCGLIPMAEAKRFNKRLFIIDDDLEDQEIFMEALREVDKSVICYTATSGEEAFRQLESEVLILPDLIFLDLNMPKQNGKQVLKELKQSRSLYLIPVIMYSTSFGPRDIDEIRHLGASHHLLKPSRFDDLCKALTEILSKEWENGKKKFS